MAGGFRESPLRLNEGLRVLEDWGEPQIMDRARQLAEKASMVWKAPVLSDDVVNLYRPKKLEKISIYIINDHPYLVEGSEMYGNTVPKLFESLSQNVLAIDPCVTEEFLKLYVAYKAETNFVDVVPQAKRLRLTINMDFHEIHDPRGIAKDITNIGRWGNGNVEVSVDSENEIPYVMGLVRQAFEKQMGNGGLDI